MMPNTPTRSEEKIFEVVANDFGRFDIEEEDNVLRFKYQREDFEIFGTYVIGSLECNITDITDYDVDYVIEMNEQMQDLLADQLQSYADNREPAFNGWNDLNTSTIYGLN